MLKRKIEIPVLPSKEDSVCRSQLQKLISLFSFFDTSNDRLTLLDNSITSLNKLKYKAIQKV